MLGAALEAVFGAHLTIGPPLASGFYYDCYIGQSKSIQDEDLKKIEEKTLEISKQKHSFQVIFIIKQSL